jgi:DNA-binding transcriptional ArsR family regulator
MNDDTIVNVWQDGIVTDQDSAPGVDQVAELASISTVEELKALTDPTRQAILEVLMGHELPVMSVKELAKALREPQTKLYRHVKVLESAGLIRVAATRMVSGIAEQRYQACQRDLDVTSGVMRQHIDEAEAITRTVFDRFRRGYFAAYRASQPSEDDDGIPLGRHAALLAASGRRTPAQIAAVRAKLAEALTCFEEGTGEEPDAVPMNLLIGYFLPPDDEPG